MTAADITTTAADVYSYRQ